VARPPTGAIVERQGKDGTARFAIRFRVPGLGRQYQTLDVRTKAEAERELAHTLADVERGLWQPPRSAPIVEEPKLEQTVHEFASEWYRHRELEGLAPRTLDDFRWALSGHLLAFFGSYPLSAVTPQLVDRFTHEKVAERQRLETARDAAKARGETFAERGLSNRSINHVVQVLGQVLEAAVDYELLASNPATGKRRRLRAEQPARPWVEPEQLMALLNSATGSGRVLLVLLAGCGLRIGEALALRWSDVDLGSATLYVRKSKTAAGVREVHLTPAVREELVLWRSDTGDTKATDLVLCTSTGRRFWPSNLRRDVLFPAIARANARLEQLEIVPIGHLTFHSLRRTYASLRCVCGDDPRYTADQLGHTDPKFTFRVYAQASKRRERLAPAQRKAFDEAIHWAQMGTNLDFVVPELPVSDAA
jgi:integrase